MIHPLDDADDLDLVAFMLAQRNRPEMKHENGDRECRSDADTIDLNFVNPGTESGAEILDRTKASASWPLDD